MSKFTLDWIKAAAIRAVRTMAQTALTMITLGVAVSDINWMQVLSVSAVAGVYSVLTSVATKLPEVGTDGTLLIDTTNEASDIYRLHMNTDLPSLASRNHVTLKVDPKAVLSRESQPL